MSLDKRRKTEHPSPPRGSKIFSPFRSLGNVTNEVPFAIGTLGATFYIVTSVGRSFQIYDAATLHLLFVSQKQTASKITAMCAHLHYVYVAHGHAIGIYKRGRLEEELKISASSTIVHISHLLVFGDYLVSASSDGILNVFKKPAGSKLHSEHYTTISSINPQFDGDIVGLLHPPTYLNKIVVATTKYIYIVNVRTGRTLYKSPENLIQENISCIECATALDIIAIGTSSGGVYLYNFSAGQILDERIVASPTDVGAKVVSVSFRSDGSDHLVAALNTGDLYFYDLTRKSRVHLYRDCHKEEFGGVSSAKFLNGQPIVVTNGGDNQLKELVFDPPLSSSNSSIITPPRHLRSRGGHSSPPVSLVFPNEEKTHFVYSASKDQTLWSFSLRKDAQAQEFSQRPPKSGSLARKSALMREKFPEITSLTMSATREGEWENMITTHKGEAFARTWDTKHKRVGRFEFATVDGGLAKCSCVSQCGNFALVGSSEGGIGVYNLQSGLLRRKYMLHKKKAVTGLAIDGMNRKMVSCGLDGIVGFYNFTDLKYLGKLQLDEPVTDMIYHKGSDLIACALDDLSIVVIDVVTQRVVRILYGHTNRITALDFSPDGHWIVSASLDGTLRTWDLSTGGCIDGIRLPSVATKVKFTPLGDFLATTHVSGNGISLWTNRAQFHVVSTRHIEESDFAMAYLPNAAGDGGASMIEGALDDSKTEDLDINQIYHSVDQVSDELITLSVGPRSKYQTILHVDTIKQRNKPKEPPKKPEQAPFFLSLSGASVGDRAAVAENGEASQIKHSEDSDGKSRLLDLRGNGAHNFESDFTRLLREGREKGDYSEFLELLSMASPSTLDLEIRSLNSFPPHTEMSSFVEALSSGMNMNTNFDTFQAITALFLKHHADVVYANPGGSLVLALDKMAEVNARQGEKLDNLVKFCSGVIDFISTS